MQQLSQRTEQILRFIVADYIETASPVGSSALANEHKLGVSPATVRNEMGKLEDDGFIVRPHTSAGGVPSDRGYRHFVQAIPQAAQPPEAERITLENELQGVEREVALWARTASTTLAELMGTLAFSGAADAGMQRVKQVELVRLQDMAALLIVILHGLEIHKILLPLDKPTAQVDLEHARNRVTAVVADKTAVEISANIPAHMGVLEYGLIDATVDVLKTEEDRAGTEFEWDGLSALLSQPEFLSNELGLQAVEALESGDLLPEITEKLPDGGVVNVFIGSELPNESMHAFSIVVCRYGAKGGVTGSIGLIGPTRLEYAKAVPVVRHAASVLDRLVSEAAS